MEAEGENRWRELRGRGPSKVVEVVNRGERRWKKHEGRGKEWQRGGQGDIGNREKREGRAGSGEKRKQEGGGYTRVRGRQMERLNRFW